MRSPGLVFLALVAIAAPGVAEHVKFPAGRFDKPAGRHGRAVSPKHVAVAGRVTRYALAKPNRRALAIENGSLRATVTIPAPRTSNKKAPKKRKKNRDAIDPLEWYGLISVDVFGRTGTGSATITLTTHAPGFPGNARSISRTIDRAAPARGTAGAASCARLRLRVPPRIFASPSARPLTIEIRVEGEAALVIDDLRVERFHLRPTKALRGKANGKLGPDRLGCGALGFDALTEHQNTAFSIYAVRPGGPAARAGLKRGDLIIAIAGKSLTPSSIKPGWAWFEDSHEARLGRAIERAIVAKQKTMRLTVLRDAGPTDVAIEVALPDAFAETFPFDDPTADSLRRDIIAWIVRHQRKNGSWPGTHAVNPALGALALLGTRDVKHRDAIERTMKFLWKKNPKPSDMKGLAYWTLAFQGILFAEYHFATGDRAVIEWMHDAARWLPTTTHTAKWGMQAFGHGPNGLPYDKKSLMAPTSHLLVFDALARRAGVESRLWEHVEPYILHSWSDPKSGGHGGMGYNGSHKDKGEFWSRSGLTALALNLRDTKPAMQSALVGIMKERHPWMLNSHAYGEPGAALGLLALATAAPKTFREIMPQWRWRFRSLWQPGFGLRYTTPHMGSPYMGEEAINNLAYGVLFAVLNRGLVIAGGEPKRWLKARRRQ